MEDRVGLAEALATLPARQRAVVVLRYCEDMSEADVAALLRMSVGTVKSHAARGLARLRAHPAVAALGPQPGPAGSTSPSQAIAIGTGRGMA